MQSKLAEQVAERGKVTKAAAGGADALELQFSRSDWWGWFKSVFTFVDESEFHPILRPASTVPRAIPDRYRMAVFSDWGTDLYGAPKIADHIRANGNFDLVMHLGDVYYSGTESEMRQRFLDRFPFLGPGTVNRGLNSNHDMYSGGHAYFGMVLPRFSQPFSYFAMQNNHWLLVCLDTAYVDFDLDQQQVDWIEAVVAAAGNRKVLFFSHHQLFSRLDSQGTELAKRLKPLLEAGAIDFWYWGHEHRCVLYEPHADFGLQGRCVGHGGIPEKRGDVEDGAAVEETAPYVWRQLTGKKGVPRSIALDGANPHIGGGIGHKYLPHGYVVIELDGDALVEAYFVSDGTRVLERRH
jgi:predicted phosphodiesterase